MEVSRDPSGRNDARPEPSRGAARGPLSWLPAGGVPIAAIVSVVGLLIIAVATLGFSNGSLPFVPGSNTGNGPGASDNPAVQRTPTPSNLVVVETPEPGIEVPGTFVYAKDGNIWLQTADAAEQLTSGGTDSMPTFSPDGSSVYFVRTRRVDGKWSIGGMVKDYRLDVPTLMQVPTAGGNPQKVLDGLVNPPGSFKWNGFIREPAISPDGRYVAIATDLPDPTTSDVVIKLYDLKTGKIKNLGLDQVPPLGHQDPAWKPDGTRLLYVRNDRDGAKGASELYAWNPANGKAKAVTKPGYLYPSWSPDGNYIAATRTSAFGTDVVILDANNGAEVVRLTSDGDSWAPVWSPAGDQIAYLHVDGQVIDLRLIQLEGTGPGVDHEGSDRPHLERGARRRLTARLVHPRRPDARPPRRSRRSTRAVRIARSGPRDDDLPRAARSPDGSHGSVLCLGVDPDPGRAARRLPGHAGGDRAVRTPSSSRRHCPTRRRSRPISHSSRRSARAGVARSSDCGPRSRPMSRSSPMASAATSARRRRGMPWRCSTRWVPMR